MGVKMSINCAVHTVTLHLCVSSDKKILVNSGIILSCKIIQQISNSNVFVLIATVVAPNDVMFLFRGCFNIVLKMNIMNVRKHFAAQIAIALIQCVAKSLFSTQIKMRHIVNLDFCFVVR